MKIIEEGKGWISLDCIMRLNPGEFLLPIIQFADCLILVVDEATGLEFVVIEDLTDFLSLLRVEEAMIISLEEVDSVCL